MKADQHKKSDKELVVFFAFIILFSAIFSTMYYVTRDSGFLTVLMFTPAVSVIISKLICERNLKELYLKPKLKGNLKWYAASYFMPPVIAAVGAVIYFLIFRNDFDPLGSAYAVEAGITNQSEYIKNLAVLIPLAILVNPIMGILQCLGEELAWRGYLLPKLSGKYPLRIAVLIDGAVWGIWHSPIIAMGYNYGTEHPILDILAMTVFCVIIGIISSYLFFRTGSVWCSVLFHASINGMDKWSASSLFMSKEANMFIGPDILGCIGGAGFFAVAFLLFVKLKKCQPES